MAEKVEIQSDAQERVAYDLMLNIDKHGAVSYEMKNKKYWLSLYRQCYKATCGCDIDVILEED